MKNQTSATLASALLFFVSSLAFAQVDVQVRLPGGLVLEGTNGRLDRTFTPVSLITITPNSIIAETTDGKEAVFASLAEYNETYGNSEAELNPIARAWTYTLIVSEKHSTGRALREFENQQLAYAREHSGLRIVDVLFKFTVEGQFVSLVSLGTGKTFYSEEIHMSLPEIKESVTIPLASLNVITTQNSHFAQCVKASK